MGDISQLSDADLLKLGGKLQSLPDDVLKKMAAAPDLRPPGTLDFDKLNYSPTVGMSALEKGAAGYQKSFADTGRGIGQALGLVNQKAVDDAHTRDEPLMNTAAGVVGNTIGHVGQAAAVGAATLGAGKALDIPWLAAAGRAALTAPTNLGGAVTSGVSGAIQGGLQPVPTGEDRAKNMEWGFGLGSAVPLAGMAAKGAKAIFEPTYAAGRKDILGRALLEATNGNSANAINALKTSGILVPGSMPTAAEASGSAGIAALQRTAAAANPEAYAERGLANNQARYDALSGVAGTDADLTKAVKARSDATAPLRNDALGNANYGTRKTVDLELKLADKKNALVDALQQKGQLQTIAAEQQGLADKYTPVPGMPRIPDRYAPNTERVPEALNAASDAAKIEAQRKNELKFLEGQFSSLKENGYSPLSAEGINVKLDGLLNDPEKGASSVVKATVGDIKKKIAAATDELGNVDARALYTIRKEIGNTIGVYSKENQNWDKRLTSSLSSGIQGSIDDAIEKAGAGDLWKQYLTKYGELSAPVNNLNIAREIRSNSLRPLDNTVMPGAFARALSDDTAQSVTGMENATLKNSMSPDSLAKLEAIKADLARSNAAQNAGRGAGSDTYQKFSMDNLMRRAGLPGAIGNFPGVDRFGKWAYDLNDQAMKQKLADTLLSPQETAALMERATPSQQAQLLSKTLRIGGANALTGLAGVRSGPSQ